MIKILQVTGKEIESFTKGKKAKDSLSDGFRMEHEQSFFQDFRKFFSKQSE